MKYILKNNNTISKNIETSEKSGAYILLFFDICSRAGPAGVDLPSPGASPAPL
jgi:hypothetical protein